MDSLRDKWIMGLGGSSQTIAWSTILKFLHRCETLEGQCADLRTHYNVLLGGNAGNTATSTNWFDLIIDADTYETKRFDFIQCFSFLLLTKMV